MSDPSTSSSQQPSPFMLTDEQLAVVQAPPEGGHLLVLAAPGSGKTRVIVERIRWLLDNRHATADQILAVTFTRQAANELQERISAGRSGSTSGRDVWAGTFHGVCYLTLKGIAAAAGTKLPMLIADEDRQRVLLQHAAEREGVPIEADQNVRRRQMRELMGHVSRHRINTGLGLQGSLDPTIVRVAEAYALELIADKTFDFDDLPLLAIKQLEGGEALPPRVEALRYVFVDEYHDVSAEQERFLNLIAPANGPRQMMIVADSDQAIYSWRGATLKPLENFRCTYKPRTLPLNVNFRSTVNIVDVARAVMPSDRDGYDMVAAPGAATGHEAVYRQYRDSQSEAQHVAQSVENALTQGYSRSDIAILYRNHFHGDPIDRELGNRGIPVLRIEPGRFFDQGDVKAVIEILRLAVMERDVSIVAAARWPTMLVDEVMLAVAQREAGRRGETVLECARAADSQRDVFGPISRRELLSLARLLDETVVGRGDQPIGDVLLRLLSELRRRCSPFRFELREVSGDSPWDVRHHRLFSMVKDQAAQLDSAIRSGRPVTLRPNGSPDAAAAVLIFEDVLGGDLGVEVATTDSTKRQDDRTFIVDLGRRVVPSVTGFGLVAMDGASAALQAFRICQWLLAEREVIDEQQFVLFDTETGDNKPTHCELVQAAVIPWQNGERQADGYITTVRPSGPEAITQDAQKIHGITWEMASQPGVPDAAEAVAGILGEFGSEIVVGHNVDEFDWIVLNQHCRRIEAARPTNPTVDTLLLARRLFVPPNGHKLESYNAHFGFSKEQNHDAGDDALLAGGLLQEELAVLRRDRELLALREYLPLVSCSMHAAGVTLVGDAAEWFSAGVRASRYGLGEEHVSRWVQGREDRQASRAYLAQSPLENTPEDTRWQDMQERWVSTISSYVQSGRDPSVEGFLVYSVIAAENVSDGMDNPSDESNGDPRVTLMTVHSAKGKEWPVVFLLSVDDETYPGVREDSTAEDIEESRRLLYVGMTRAKKVLVLTRARVRRNAELSDSRFVKDVPSSLLRRNYIT